MKHLSLSLWTALMLAACDAAMVASAQQDQAPADGMLAGSVENSEQTENTVLAQGDKPEIKDDPKVEASIKPETLDLESINFMVKKGKVKDAAELEKKINNPKEKLNTVDVDGDGKIDKIQVVEVQKPNDVKVFELHVIPSKTKKKEDEVIVAYIHFQPDVETKQLIVKATYAPIVIGHDTIVYDYHVPIVVNAGKIVVVETNPFYGWMFTVSRPAFVGVYVYTAPPPPVIIIEHGWHGHHKHKHKGKWKGKGHHGWH
jgi:hypothetical protein